MNQDRQQPLRMQAATVDDCAAALELVYTRFEPAERRRRIDDVLAASPQAVEGLWVAYRGNALVAALLAPIVPGRTALVTPPRVAKNEPAKTAVWLLKEVVGQWADAGVQLAQALVNPADFSDARVLFAAGFQRVTDLLFLVCVRGSFPNTKPATALEFISYSPALHVRLATIVEQTYVDSFDCPEVEGVRAIDDILIGYRATAAFDPSLWMLVSHAGRDIGCLLLADHAASNQMELVYMGLAPEARQRGWGAAVVRHAQWLAWQAGRGRIVLAVDVRNSPAVAAYAQANFVSWDQKGMFLRTF